jgi:hypothetical protein
MASVVFSCGTRPVISEHEAIELSMRLAEAGSVAGFTAAWKISDAARRHIGLLGFGEELELDDEELSLVTELAVHGSHGVAESLVRLRADALTELLTRRSLLSRG